MLEVMRSGGWLMLPIVICSILSLGIILERFFALRRAVVVPSGLTVEVERALMQGRLDADRIAALRRGSVLGRVLAAGLACAAKTPARLREAIEEAGRHAVHDLERYLNALGTIAATTPLLGLLGTVIGMIKVFAAITTAGVGDPQILAGGIYEALITTAAGLSVGIPSLMFHRYFRGRINELTVEIEQQALRLIEALRGRLPE
ncbi:MAG: biopolymer transporter ExbB [Acidiferrobacteraceae bacterium]|jgi:biopolymer transport protein ExbB|nr:biopolymer transporter ExbB [Acidiferrobacteraceae bacterium]HJP06960.1 MotA/TolQ/ExbB proton channel family protein [Arenicellales bacterium]|tara:strand:- start:2073 stop:2684 length:612 start_codon:yes stop_codon:yes gene_type:complete